jgi:hypothetical protein
VCGVLVETGGYHELGRTCCVARRVVVDTAVRTDLHGRQSPNPGGELNHRHGHLDALHELLDERYRAVAEAADQRATQILDVLNRGAAER